MQGSPLKVRKTRENLRQVITQSQETKTNSTPVVPGNSGFENTRPLRSEDHRPLTHHSTMDTLSLSSPAYSVMHVENSRGSAVTQPVARRQSVRKRVVSRMKEGLLSRSKSISKVSFPDQADALNRSETLSARGGEVKFTGGGSHHVRNQSAQTLPALLGGTSGTVEDLPPSSQEEQNLIPLSRTPELDDASQVQEVMPDISPRSQHSIQESRPSRITPPLSCSPSPEQTPRPARRPTRLIEEAEVSHRPEILHVALTIVPAVAAVDINDDANTWVKIEAEAKIDTPVIEATSRSEGAVGNGFESQHAIDLILIVDNSFVTMLRYSNKAKDADNSKRSCYRADSTRYLRHYPSHLQLLANVRRPTSGILYQLSTPGHAQAHDEWMSTSPPAETEHCNHCHRTRTAPTEPRRRLVARPRPCTSVTRRSIFFQRPAWAIVWYAFGQNARACSVAAVAQVYELSLQSIAMASPSDQRGAVSRHPSVFETL